MKIFFCVNDVAHFYLAYFLEKLSQYFWWVVWFPIKLKLPVHEKVGNKTIATKDNHKSYKQNNQMIKQKGKKNENRLLKIVWK